MLILILSVLLFLIPCPLSGLLGSSLIFLLRLRFWFGVVEISLLWCLG